MGTIKQRKKDHIELSTTGDAEYSYSAGFDRFRFIHNALPEVNMDDVTTECFFMGRKFAFPLFISSMTGGYTDAGRVNTVIAEFCEAENLPFGVGSQRIMLEDPDTTSSFSIVRKKAPNAYIASNIGGAQLIGGLSKKKLNLLIDSIEADAVIVHLNPLQELMQPEGDRKFEGIEAGISTLVKSSPVPVFIKETGAGISGEVAERLLDLGVAVIDVSGSGGTSWAKIENYRSPIDNSHEIFNEWGIPTVDCLREVSTLKEGREFELIASGGIRTSFDIVKALCLGADFTASAGPVIKAIKKDGYEGIERLYLNWRDQVTIILALLGCKDFSQLGMNHIKVHV